jgi:hypothetical protein|tara:strand:+ start:86 stop:391 length:306 start_codon:yes stop_codon:yes gene_type:complete
MAVKYTMKDYEYLIGEGGDIHVYNGTSLPRMSWKKLTKSAAKSEFKKYLPPVDELWLDDTEEAKAVYEGIRDEYVKNVGDIGMLYYRFEFSDRRKIFRVTP